MRRFIAALGGAIILVVLAWLGIWFYAEMHLKQLAEARISQFNKVGGNQVLYKKLITSDSPFVISIALVNPQLKIIRPSSNMPLFASAARIGMHIAPLHPLTLHVDWPLIVNVRDMSHPNDLIVFSSATASMVETLNPSVWFGNYTNPVSAVNTKFTNINLLASNGSLQIAWIDSFSSHTTFNNAANTSQNALSLQYNIRNLRVSPVLTKLFSLPFNGEIKQISTSLMISGPLNIDQMVTEQSRITNEDEYKQFLLQTTHDWAKAGGHTQGSLTLDLGPSLIDANFAAAFDQQIQPKGTMNVTVSNLNELADSLNAAYPTFKDYISQAEAMLAPYMFNTENGPILKINAAFGQPGIFVNGKQDAAMPTLDWNSLLNPSAAPAFAPGDGSGAATQ